MPKRETAIEIKVGALVLFALSLLVAFVLVLGDFSFEDGHRVFVDFDHAGGLKPGADVMIAGIKAGKVERLEFLGGKLDPEVKRNVVVRAEISVQPEMADSIRTNSDFFITTQGVLGEKYVEIITPNLDSPAATSGTKLRGVDPPRIDILLARAAHILERLAELLSSDEVPILDLIRNANNLMKHSDEILVENKGAVASIMKNADVAVADLPAITGAVKDGLGDGADVRATLKSVRSASAKVDKQIDPLARKINTTLDNAEVVSADARTIAADIRGLTSGKKDAIAGTVDNVYATSADAKVAMGDVRKVTSGIQAGKGTVGGLIKDEEIYDDLKEMLRELKRRPWKIIWKD